MALLNDLYDWKEGDIVVNPYTNAEISLTENPMRWYCGLPDTFRDKVNLISGSISDDDLMSDGWHIKREPFYFQS